MRIASARKWSDLFLQLQKSFITSAPKMTGVFFLVTMAIFSHYFTIPFWIVIISIVDPDPSKLKVRNLRLYNYEQSAHLTNVISS